MGDSLASPAFGEADLTNCERELIHLAGSIQPHGVLLVLDAADRTVRQASANTAHHLGVAANDLLERPIADLGGDIDAQIAALAARFELREPRTFTGRTSRGGERRFEGNLHRLADGCLVVELEPQAASRRGERFLRRRVAAAVQRFSAALSLPSLCDAVVQCFRDLTGYDRVMVYRFDPDGHGEIIAEARDERLESLLGHHYPSTDIPQRARELYLRNRVRLLVDVAYEAVPIVPRRTPGSGEELDMSMCSLRSMSPLHIQYLKNMGVTATLVVSLVREGRLWGLIACHHYSPLHLDYATRAACDLMAEVISTRIAGIENYVHAQVEVLVRRLELRLTEATSTEGDWRPALLRNPKTLLQPLEATGAVLFYDGEIHTAGEVPSTPDLRALVQWIAAQGEEPLFANSSVTRASPALASLATTASGVLAVRLSTGRPDFLVWLRREQVCTVTWAGDPAKPVVNDDPLELSPRRSFATWSQIVRGTATPWSKGELVLAQAIGASLRDIIVQVQAVRLLIAHHQLQQFRVTVENTREPVILADAGGRILFANEAFTRLIRRPHAQLQRLEDLVPLFVDPQAIRAALRTLREEHQPWRGELALAGGHRDGVPVALRADVVPGPAAGILGMILMLNDLTEAKRTEAARRHLESSLADSGRMRLESGVRPGQESDETLRTIVANASVAAMEIAEISGSVPAAQMIEELEASARRATALYGQLQDHGRGEQGE